MSPAEHKDGYKIALYKAAEKAAYVVHAVLEGDGVSDQYDRARLEIAIRLLEIAEGLPPGPSITNKR